MPYETNKFKKTLSFFTAVLIIGLIAFFGVYFYLNNPERVVAKIGDEKITKRELDYYAPRFLKASEYAKNSNAKKDYKAKALQKMIQDKAVLAEAKKNRVTVSEKEIDEEYEDMWFDEYGNEQNFKDAIGQAYDWTPELTKESIKLRLLEKKLRSKVIGGSEVWGVFVRWDWAGSKLAPEKEKESAQISYDKINNEFSSLFKKGASKKDIQEKIKEVQKDSQWAEPIVGMIQAPDVNEETEKMYFTGREDWQAIKNLSQKDNVSEITKSTGGYYVIYKLVQKTNGDFNTWEQFLTAKEKRSNVLTLDYKIYNAKKAVVHFNTKLKDNFKKGVALLKPKKADAATIDCSSNHFSEFRGRTRDGATGLNLGSSKITAQAGSIGTYPKCHNPQESSSASVTSDSAGWFIIGTKTDPNQKLLSCWVRWDVTVSNTGYFTVSYDEASLQANGVWTWLDNGLDRSYEKFNGDYDAENTDNDGYIYLKPKIYKINVRSSGTTSVPITANPSTFGGTTSYSKTDSGDFISATLTAPVSANGKNFIRWNYSGCASASRSGRSITCIVNDNSPYRVATVTAQFSGPPDAYYTSPDTGTVFNTNPVGRTVTVSLCGYALDPENSSVKLTFRLYSGNFDSSWASYSDWVVSGTQLCRGVNFKELDNGEARWKWDYEAETAWKGIDGAVNNVFTDRLHGISFDWNIAATDTYPATTATVGYAHDSNGDILRRFTIFDSNPIPFHITPDDQKDYTGSQNVSFTVRADEADGDQVAVKIEIQSSVTNTDPNNDDGWTFSDYVDMDADPDLQEFSDLVTGGTNITSQPYTVSPGIFMQWKVYRWKVIAQDQHSNNSNMEDESWRIFWVYPPPAPVVASCILEITPTLGFLPLSVDFKIKPTNINWVPKYYDLDILRTNSSSNPNYVSPLINRTLSDLLYIYSSPNTYYPAARVKDGTGVNPRIVDCTSSPATVQVNPWNISSLKEIAP